MKKLFFIVIAAFLLFSWSTIPQKTVDENSDYVWKSETFELNPQNQAFSAEGDVTMWVNVEQYKGKFSGDYQIVSASPEKWRMIITGPFSISVATVIIIGDNSYIENCIVESHGTIKADSRFIGEDGVAIILEKNERYMI